MGRVTRLGSGERNDFDTGTLRTIGLPTRALYDGARRRHGRGSRWRALTYVISAQYAGPNRTQEIAPAGPVLAPVSCPLVQITLNGERFELDQPLSVTALLARLDVDPRRVAVEHNLEIIKRQRFPDVVVSDGDTVEIVNFVGGG